jgi:hypothetical protein
MPGDGRALAARLLLKYVDAIDALRAHEPDDLGQPRRLDPWCSQSASA